MMLFKSSLVEYRTGKIAFTSGRILLNSYRIKLISTMKSGKKLKIGNGAEFLWY
jgi:hypothetical protein